MAKWFQGTPVLIVYIHIKFRKPISSGSLAFYNKTDFALQQCCYFTLTKINIRTVVFLKVIIIRSKFRNNTFNDAKGTATSVLLSGPPCWYYLIHKREVVSALTSNS